MKDMSLEKMLRLADENLADTIRNRTINSEKGKIYENKGYMIYTIGVDNEDGHINGVLCLDDKYAKEALQKADEFFSPMKRNYIVWVRGHGNQELERILQNKGLEPKRRPGSAGMIIRDKIKTINIPSASEVKVVDTAKRIKDFSLVIKEAFDKPNEVISEMFTENTMLNSSKNKALLIYQNNLPVAAVSVTISGGVGGLYWVGTVEGARGQGLGSYITQAATNMAFDEAAKLVVLQASIAGERVYHKLGYETITHYRWYAIKY